MQNWRVGPWSQASSDTYSKDGTRLHLSYGGPKDGLTPLICANGVGVSTFFWNHLGTHFSAEREVVVWDYPGHGVSDHPKKLSALTLPRLADDLLRVLDARGIDRAVLLGHSLGCQVILEAYHQAPDRVAGLVPVLGTYRSPADHFLHPAVGPRLFKLGYALGQRAPKALTKLVQRTLSWDYAWPIARHSGLIHTDMARREDIQPYLDNLAEQDLQVFLEVLKAAQAHDAGPYLSEIQVPTLVVSGERDVFTPKALSIAMAQAIPGAEILEIPRGSHAALVEQPELFNLRLEKFLRQRVDVVDKAGRPSEP